MQYEKKVLLAWFYYYDRQCLMIELELKHFNKCRRVTTSQSIQTW